MNNPAGQVIPEGAADDKAASPRLSARRRATRNRLLDAARATFALRGVAGSTVEEICEAAGFTRGAFYSNFADRDDLAAALLAREAERVLAALDEAANAHRARVADGSGEHSDLADLASVVEAFFRFQTIDRDYYLILTELTLHAIREPAYAPAFLELTRGTRLRITQAVHAALARIGREPLLPIDQLIAALFGVFEVSQREALLAGEDDLWAHAREQMPRLLMALTRRAV